MRNEKMFIRGRGNKKRQEQHQKETSENNLPPVGDAEK
jgi:hypothetical protein